MLLKNFVFPRGLNNKQRILRGTTKLLEREKCFILQKDFKGYKTFRKENVLPGQGTITHSAPKILRGAKFPVLEGIRGMTFSSARENKV